MTTTSGRVVSSNCKCNNSVASTSSASSSTSSSIMANGGEDIKCAAVLEAAKIAHRLHQLELGQRKMLHILTRLESELCCGVGSSASNSGSSSHHHHNNKGSTKAHHYSNTSSNCQGWVREEDGQGDGERIVKIQLQDATTSTKHVGFRIDKSCQTFRQEDLEKQEKKEEEEAKAREKSREQEIADLREELKVATQALQASMVVNDKGEIDFGAESPLNLFIQCFKKKYDVSVNPNDVAIFV